jgi:hypothetical protein
MLWVELLLRTDAHYVFYLLHGEPLLWASTRTVEDSSEVLYTLSTVGGTKRALFLYDLLTVRLPRCFFRTMRLYSSMIY